MIWVSAAFAAPPEVLAVAPFDLERAEPAAVSPWRPPFREGTLLSLKVDPATRVPSQLLTPSWWVGDQPVRSFGFDPVGGCAVFVVEGPVDLATAEVFLGPAELAERVDAATAAARRRDAVAAGAVPLPAAAVAATKAPVAHLPHGGALNALGESLMATCTGRPPGSAPR